MSEGFLAQTAFDYDIPIEDVKQIAEKYPNGNEFYEKLEEYLILRANS
jgi:hypothetical protein